VVPPDTDQPLYGVTPPVALRPCEYVLPTTPFGSGDTVRIVGPPDRLTVKICVTGVAAAHVELPDWLAVMAQVPADKTVATFPETLHTDRVVEVNVTVNPELAVAFSVIGDPGRVTELRRPNVIVCACRPDDMIVKLCATGVAAAHVELPNWLATMVQVPADIAVTAFPEMAHIDGVVEVKVMASPELAVAFSAIGDEGKVTELRRSN
jgi:hypothetical protein